MIDALFSDLGAGAIFAWLALPVLALAVPRTEGTEPSSRCRALTLVLLLGAGLFVLPLVRRATELGADAPVPSALAAPIAAARTASFATPLGGVSLLAVVGVAWLVLAATGAARGLVAAAFVRRILRRAAPAPIALTSRLATLAKRWGLVPPRLLVSNDCAVPFTTGALRPSVVVPRTLVEILAPAEIELVLLHELAHVERRDLARNAVLALPRALFAFHPTACRLLEDLCLARELAVDARVGEIAPDAYPRVLLDTAHHARFGVPVRGAVAMYRSDLGARLFALTDLAPRRPVSILRPLLVGALVTSSAIAAPRLPDGPRACTRTEMAARTLKQVTRSASVVAPISGAVQASSECHGRD